MTFLSKMFYSLKVLGISLNLKDDILSNPGPSNSEENSRGFYIMRQVTASIYDQLGYFVPIILEAKVFIQEIDWNGMLNIDPKEK